MNIEKPHIISLGHLNSQEILHLSWMQENMNAFNDKVVVDFWCGFSNVLWQILDLSYPKKLVWVDVIFENEETYVQGKQCTQEELRVLETACLWIPDTVRKIIEKRYMLDNFEFHPEIDYHASMPFYLKEKVDYLFVNFLLYKIQNKQWFISELQTYLNERGKIIITDFDLDNQELPVPYLINTIKDSISSITVKKT